MFSNINKKGDSLYIKLGFPSPFGVICSLIMLKNILIVEKTKFPSPFGVICSLIY